MLVLKRRREQIVRISPGAATDLSAEVEVKVLQISGDWVKLGITAPAGWVIVWIPSARPDNPVAATQRNGKS